MANGVKFTDMCKLLDCGNQAPVRRSEDQSEDEDGQEDKARIVHGKHLFAQHLV